MKAVYEMPKVSFEAFMANNAVSACGYTFDCVKHEDIYGKHDKQHEDVSPSYVATFLGFNGCKQNAGFADYVEGYGQNFSGADTRDPNDDIRSSAISFWGDDHTTKNGNLVTWTENEDRYGNDYTTVDVTTTDGFMGWLYIGGSFSTISGQNWFWQTAKHSWLAPLFSTKSSSGVA